MRTTHLILLAGALAALIIGDVIEIRFHAERLTGLPGALTAAARDASLYEKIRAAVVSGKRVAEKVFIKDDKQRLEIALQYVVQDSARLKDLSAGKSGPQANLLQESLAEVETLSQTVSVEDLIALKDKAAAAFHAAQEIEQSYETVKNKLAQVRAALETQIGKLGEVAGVKEENSETPVPLKF